MVVLMAKRFLVTGGAGYVGSHVVLALRGRGDEVVVVDDLRTGHRAALPEGVRLIVGDAGDAALLDPLLSQGEWHGVLHFAAMSLVGDSMREPYRYLLENAVPGIRLIEACARHGVRRFVLSSTANLFDQADRVPIDEATPIIPGSPYGESKFFLERTLHWADRIHGLRSACLRYFNAAGADPDGRAGEDHTPESHLIPLAIDAALGRRPPLQVFGTDYPTPDGTCIRDYVHVSDLAQAHLGALDQLGERSVTYNLGNGQGHSVLQVMRAIERITGRRVPHVVAARRAGDAAVLVAGSDRIRRETGWTPRHADLDDIVATAYAWRLAHPHGYGDEGRPGAPPLHPAGA
jgi:UDP-glucose 4-epimerase